MISNARIPAAKLESCDAKQAKLREATQNFSVQSKGVVIRGNSTADADMLQQLCGTCPKLPAIIFVDGG